MKEKLKGELYLKVLNYPPDINILCFLLNWIPDKEEVDEIEAHAKDLKMAKEGLLHMNCFAEAVYKQFTFNKEKALSEHNFIISYTRFKYDEYGKIDGKFLPNNYEHGMQEHLKTVGIEPHYFTSGKEEYKNKDLSFYDNEIFVFRCTVMNPWFAVRPDKERVEEVVGKDSLYYMKMFMEELEKTIIRIIKEIKSDPENSDYGEKTKDKISRHRDTWRIKD